METPFNEAANSSAAPPEAAAPAAPTSVSAPTEYKPSGKIGPLGWPLLAVTFLLAPVVLGYLYDVSAHFGLGLLSSMWMILIAAAVLGGLVGAAFFPAIQLGKVRNAPLVLGLAFVAGLGAFGVSMLAESNKYRGEMIEIFAPIMAKEEKISASQAQAQLSERLSLFKTAQIYWGARVEDGLTVSRRGSGTQINGTMFVALKAIEALLCSIGAVIVANLLVSRRFCEEFNRWYVSKNLFNVLPDAVPALVAAGNAGQWEQFRQIAAASKDPNYKEFKPSITLFSVPDKEGGIVQIRGFVSANQNVGTVFEREVSGEELRRLMAPSTG